MHRIFLTPHQHKNKHTGSGEEKAERLSNAMRSVSVIKQVSQMKGGLNVRLSRMRVKGCLIQGYTICITLIYQLL